MGQARAAERRTKRARRAARRAARHERDRHESALHATLMSTTSLSAASFLITISRSTILKIDDALVASVVDLALAGFLLMGFGMLCLWCANLVRAHQPSKVFMFAGCALCVVTIWSVSGYEELAQPAREAMFYQELNPRALRLPSSTCSMYSSDSDLLLSLDEEEVWFARSGDATPARVDDASMEQSAHTLIDNIRHEKALLQQVFRPPSVSVSAPRCTTMNELDAYAQRLMTTGIYRFSFNVFGTLDIESHRLPDLILVEAPDEHATPDEELVVRLSRARVEVSYRGRVIASEGCYVGVHAACEGMLRMQDTLCTPVWNTWSLSRSLEEALWSIPLDDRPVYVLVVEPDVALQHVVTLHDVMMGAFVGEPGEPSRCVQGRYILLDGQMRVSKPVAP